MKTETQLNQQQNRPIFNAARIDGQSCSNETAGFVRNVEKESIKEACLRIVDSIHPGDQKCSLEIKPENGNSTNPNSPCRQSAANEMALKMGSGDEFWNGPWRSTNSSDLASVSDVIDRKMSFESIDLEVPIPSIDIAPSLDDVFDVLDAEMNFLGPDVAMGASLTVPSTHFMNDLYESQRSNCSYQSPGAYIPNSYPSNAFQGFNFGLVKGLKNPSRGLITAMRRLCDLLSKPRSDHLDSIFVRLLNETLKEMEEAARPHSKRPRRNSARQAIPYRQRKRANKSASEVERSREAANIRLSRSFASKSHSLPVISSQGARSTETVDLTVLEDGEKANVQQADSKGVTQKEPFIALEDTMPVFMSSLI